jgi:hypothetical protein
MFNVPLSFHSCDLVNLLFICPVVLELVILFSEFLNIVTRSELTALKDAFVWYASICAYGFTDFVCVIPVL